MKKYLFLLLAFAVAVATTSCEKEALPNVTEEQGQDEEIGARKLSNIEEGFVGIWRYRAYADERDQMTSHVDYVFHFWDNGKGYRTSDTYSTQGVLLGYGRAPFEWYVENGRLYIHIAHVDQAGEWDYQFDGSRYLTLSTDTDEGSISMEFTKGEDIDLRFMGDWDTTKRVGDLYINEHIQFVTPTDGFTYSLEYTDPNLPPKSSNTMSRYFKYVFDDDTITITWFDSGCAVGDGIDKKYRIEGTKLYIDGVCYSNFKKEQGIE